MRSGTPRFTCRSGVGLLILLYIHHQSQRSLSSAGVRPKRPTPRSKGASRSATGRSGSGECIGSGLLVDNGTLSVLQTLALAGGSNHTAKMSGARAYS